MTPAAAALHAQVAARAAEIGDWPSVCSATCNLFGMATASANVAEMRRLRPALEGLIRPETSGKALGWVYYHLAVSAYVDGQLDQAVEFADRCVDQAQAVEHQYLLATAFQIRFLSRWARDGVMTRDELAGGLERVRRSAVKTDAVVLLWFVARYAASVEAESAAQWLVHAERALAELDSEMWPESKLRDETMDVLGLCDLASSLERTPQLDHVAALTEAAAWLDGREPGERAVRAALAPTP